MTPDRRMNVVMPLATALMLGIAFAAVELACRHTPASIVTPQGAIAFQSEDVLSALGALQDAAITARRVSAISTPTMRAIVKVTLAIEVSINAAIDNGAGAKAVYLDGDVALTQAETLLSTADRQRFAVPLASVHTILRALAQ